MQRMCPHIVTKMEPVRRGATPKKFRAATSLNTVYSIQTAFLEDYIEPVDQDQMQQDLVDLMSIIKRAKEMHEEAINFSQDSHLRVNKIRYLKKKLQETKEINLNIREDNKRLKRKMKRVVDFISNPKRRTSRSPNSTATKSREGTRIRIRDIKTREDSDLKVISSLKALNKAAQAEIASLAARVQNDDFNYNIIR
jgi:predicted DNA-binding ribbon-helix-helix protein